MKKIILIAMLAIAGFANAQKGTYLVMGNVGFATNKNDNGTSESKSTTFTIAPKVGYQFTDHWTLGVLAQYGHNKLSSDDNFVQEITTNSYSLGVFARYTQPLSDLFSVYGDLSTSFNNSKTKYSDNDFESKSNGFGVSFTPAVYMNLKNHFGLNFGIGGLSYGHSSSEGSKTNAFNLDFGNSFTVGVSKNF